MTLDEIGEGSAALFCLTNIHSVPVAEHQTLLQELVVLENGSFLMETCLVNSSDSGDDIYRGRGPSVCSSATQEQCSNNWSLLL